MRARIPYPRLRRRPRLRDGRSPGPHQPAVPDPAPRIEDALPGVADAAVIRVRRAGGPVDEASYTCACGYVFKAAVSTSVTCPHCGAGQAW